MRNTAPITHFPPTLFSPTRSPIYGEARLFSQPASRLVTGNPSLQKGVNRRLEYWLQLFWGCHSRGLGLAPDSTGRLQGVLRGHIVPAQDEKLEAALQAFLPAIGRGSRVGASGALARSEYREKENL